MIILFPEVGYVSSLEGIYVKFLGGKLFGARLPYSTQVTVNLTQIQGMNLAVCDLYPRTNDSTVADIHIYIYIYIYT